MAFISILTLDTLVIYNVIHLDGANLYNFNNNNNNNNKSALSRGLATLKIFSTVTVYSFLVGGVAVVYSSGVGTWLLDIAPGARLPEFAGLFSIVCSAKLSDNVRP